MKTLTKKECEMAYLMRRVENVKRINPDKNSYSEITPFLYRMDKYERQLQRLAELSCNGYPMPKVEYRDGKMFCFDVEDVKLRERCEKREAIIELKVIEEARELNLEVDFQGDPRGLMFRLVDKDGKEVA